MDYELLNKQYVLINESTTKEEKQWLFQTLINKENVTEEEIYLYGEILEEE